ncbi:YtxH domain-containing protein [Chrysiogenes arsenatis]|uniref:YtxH domain-containing protein n=1 Tax=Chrysiogenes arsenatis TaxID=309797 RepID=UPI000401A87A|nr:YtxH domain-containing protein [Chrysiogenes arsenatis]
MAYHFLIGAVVGAASILLLKNRKTKEIVDKGSRIVKENIDTGVRAVQATGACIREKMQEMEKATPALEPNTEEVIADGEMHVENEAPKPVRRRRKPDEA